MHSHVLPGIDDGAQSFKESCAMIEMARAVGVRGICATAPLCSWEIGDTAWIDR